MLVDEISTLCNEKLLTTQKEMNKLRVPLVHHSNTNKSLAKDYETRRDWSNSPKPARWSKVKCNLSKITNMPEGQTTKIQQALYRKLSKSWDNIEKIKCDC